MDLGLREARVLVTGGAANIGRGIVHGFAEEGARVAICDIDGEQAGRVRKEALERGAAAAEVVQQDLTEEGAGARVVGRVLELWDGIDVLVNNAGWSVPGFIAEDTDRARWQRLVEVNLYGTIECTQAAIGPMREAGQGSIVFISSDAAFGEIRQGVYGATKAAVLALARTVAKEHGRHGIRSNVVCPGLVLPEDDDAIGSTSLWAVGQDSVFDADQIDYIRKQIPLRRLTTAQDIAASVVWVSSERAARQVTGQVFSVSGGYSMP
ncbi:SDR family NAD(P)-dependent oxidoreductase [Thermocrispum municipale]|uniref:SDR family NAD(P)-dependent oxidoreductase n=1 Tax=Thermocrispum municipale TaxID=37926 RepID=UPI0004188238|nr:SDR family oxidoreductase [Thermocrispum municipale]